ncbi:metallophosphoesterase family protein [Candidatus Halobonum tyrrellensis]|uniref:Metallophosphoesterase n=1 Tax=Candidatus Halobonum tyrrellensis G22 TaxID=1324957 RepID=V4HJL4_9EURY|nr:metallophosphoesterase [Candidatus Halobonum tyrrellensis]ESP88109.1 metallophosphoesterase [Candidatus Halobonum tyrrellensis G22]
MNDDRAAGSVLARLARPAGPHTRFAVVADPHVATRAEGTSKLFEHSRDHLAAAVADINDRAVDAVLSPGDLTKDGEPWNYDAVDEVLSDLDAPFYAVPGNHDVPKESDEHDRLPVSGFAERYGPGELPFRVEVGGLDVLGVNSSGTSDRLYDSHDGRVTDADRAWLADALADAERPVVLVHHNFPPVSDQVEAHREAEPEMALPPVMRDPDPLAETLVEGGADVAFTGHYHLPATGFYGGVREIAAPTTCSFPQAYLLCETTPDGTTVRFVPVADEAGLGRAHALRTADSVTSRGLTALAAARVASFPLVDES